MDSMYANSFGVTTTEGNEVFLTFQMVIPQFDENGKQTGEEQKASTIIVMGGASFQAFKELINNMGVKE